MSTMIASKKQMDLVYDVGMHKGEDTDFYLKKGFRVISFEADPDLVSHCRKRFSKEIENGRLIIIEGAIVADHEKSSTKSVTFYKNKNNTVWGTIVEDWAHRNEILGAPSELIHVSTVNFTQCIVNYGIPHYMKIDIEGMDTLCLKALLCFNEKPDYISIESNKLNFRDLLDEFALFTKLGFNKFKVIQQNTIANQVEPQATKEGTYASYQFLKGSSGLFGDDLPGKWISCNKAVTKYKIIFQLYKYFGNYGVLKKYYLGRMLTSYLSKWLGRPIPGWYDTHAKHSSIS